MTRLTLDGAEGAKTLDVDMDLLLEEAETAEPAQPLVEAGVNALEARLRRLGVMLSDLGRRQASALLQEIVRNNRTPAKHRLQVLPLAEPEPEQAPSHAMEGFDVATRLPNASSQDRYQALIGLDHEKARVLDIARELADPGALRDWLSRHHPGRRMPLTERLAYRPPLLLLSGDVGCGKTELAETFPDALARELNTNVWLLRFSLANRGEGFQGQATQRIASAFANARALCQRDPQHRVVVLVDEADALAQSRDEQQMHHEDRAGVNGLIQALDACRELQGRMLIVFCTNRPDAVDPALQRRAALHLRFVRPDAQAAEQILCTLLGDVAQGWALDDIAGRCASEHANPAYTCSDLVNRLLPEALRSARTADRPLVFQDLLDAIERTPATPAFGQRQQHPM